MIDREKEIKYVDIMNHFEINKGVMQNLKKKINKSKS